MVSAKKLLESKKISTPSIRSIKKWIISYEFFEMNLFSKKTFGRVSLKTEKSDETAKKSVPNRLKLAGSRAHRGPNPFSLTLLPVATLPIFFSVDHTTLTLSHPLVSCLFISFGGFREKVWMDLGAAFASCPRFLATLPFPLSSSCAWCFFLHSGYPLDVCAAHRIAAIALRAATRASGERKAVGSFTLSCLTRILFQRDAELSSLGLSHDHHWKILDKYICLFQEL
jgi:hypothetical protein